MINFSLLTHIKPIKLVVMLCLLTTLQGCVVATVVAITAGTSIATDRRSVSHQIDDQRIELHIYNEITRNKSLKDNTNVQIVSVNGAVLMIGQAPNTYLRDQLIKIANAVDGVVKIHNQVRIGNIISVTTQSNDVWLTSKIKTALFSSKDVKGKSIKVVTENAEVFLMGIVSKQEADAAIDVTRNVSGINRVFNAFEYL